MKLTKVTLIIIALGYSITLSTCKKEDPKLNLVLYDKSLEIIKSNVQGNWKLQMVTGGICSTCSSPVKDNPFMTIADDHIIIGNNNVTMVDTLIVWQRIKYDYGNYHDSTYLLTYLSQKYYSSSINYVVERVENNNLVLMDYSSDPFSYYFLK